MKVDEEHDVAQPLLPMSLHPFTSSLGHIPAHLSQGSQFTLARRNISCHLVILEYPGTVLPFQN